MKTNNCSMCGRPSLDKDTIGVNKKLLGTSVKSFLCMDCLANYLGCTPSDILEKIEEFKAEGCKLFE